MHLASVANGVLVWLVRVRFSSLVGTTPSPPNYSVRRNESGEIESSDHTEITVCPEATNDGDGLQTTLELSAVCTR